MGTIENCGLHKCPAFWFNLCFWNKLAQNCFKKVKDLSGFWWKKKRSAFHSIAVKVSSIAFNIPQHIYASKPLHVDVDTWRFLCITILHIHKVAHLLQWHSMWLLIILQEFAEQIENSYLEHFWMCFILWTGIFESDRTWLTNLVQEQNNFLVAARFPDKFLCFDASAAQWISGI